MIRRFVVISACVAFSSSLLADGSGLQSQQRQGKRSGLPWIVFCTKEEIPKDKSKKAQALMQWKDNAYEGDMSCEDTQGWQAISMKYRGNSSMRFAKKQYGFETLDEEGEKVKIRLGSMPKGSKWILRSPYIDRSFMRDAFAYQLGRDFGFQRGDEYAAPRTEFVEVAINGDYKGIFTLTEKIHHGHHHVPIEKLDVKNLRDLTYIAEISAGKYEGKSKRGTMFNIKDPSPGKLNKLDKHDLLASSLVREMILFDINRFEDALSSDHFTDSERGYRSLIDFDSFVDYFILQEFTKNIDGFRRSEYFYKGKDGKIHMGPFWDFDIAMGNLSFYGMAKTTGWAHTKHWTLLPNAFWFKRLLKDPDFVQAVHTRYFELRQEGNLLNWRSLEDRIDELATQLGDAPERDKIRWQGTYGFLQRHFMNTKQRSKSFPGNVRILKTWIKGRLHWLDRKIGVNSF